MTRPGGNGRRGPAEKIDFKRIAEAALNSVETLLKEWLPDGHKAGPEWKARNPTRSDNNEGSFSINMATGAWGDFAAGDTGGDLVSLCAYLFHGGDQLAGVRDVAERLGIALPPPPGDRSRDPVSPGSAPPADKSSPSAETAAGGVEASPRRVTEWVPLRTAPADAPEAHKAHIKRGLPETVWHYRDADGATLGYVFRFKTSDGGKEVLPLCWAQHAVSGKAEWRWMHFGEPRPLYGLDRLAVKPEATVLVVEGEKCADIAHSLFPALAVVTWPGGTNAEHKADWSPLAGRKVMIWPDADAKRERLSKDEKEAGFDPLSKPFLEATRQPGLKAALKIAERLHDLGGKVWMVKLPEPGALPDGWDVADMCAAGQIGHIDEETSLAWLRENAALWVPETPAESISTASGAAAEERGKNWYGALLRTQKGDIAPVVANVYDVLIHDEAWRGIIAFDEHAQRVIKRQAPPYVNGVPGEWKAEDDTQTAIWITRRYRFAPSSGCVTEAVETLARTNSFHPIQDWLRSLPAWDGEKRIGGWLVAYLGAEGQSEDQKEYLRLAGGWYLMGMVARAMRPGCKFDYSLVLEGEQGKTKSTALNVLAGDEWFGDTDLDLHNKDSMISLQGKWLYEIAEMGAMARSDEKRQKSFLSRRFDEFRMPYGTRNVKLPRGLVFAGTTNEWEWNKDPTGGRRFWPVSCGTLDVAGLAAVREQLFAEALAYFEAGKRYWPTWDEQKRYFDPEQLKREQQESLIDSLHDWVFLQYADFSIAQAGMDCLKLDASKMTRDMQTRIGVALRKLGCTKVEKRNGMTRFWYKPPARNGAGSTAGDVAQEGSEYVGF